MEEPSVIYKDPHFLIINKPAGLQVHPARVAGAKAGDHAPTLVDWLVKNYPEVKSVGDDLEHRPGIVHRLDKETSGVMIVPRDQETFLYLKDLFQKHEVKKTYLAVVAGAPKEPEGVIDAPIGIRNGTLKRSIHSMKMQKPAVTEYRLLKEESGRAVLEVRPRTGRTHQIRVHLASIGRPVLGDRLYGPKRSSAKTDHMMLHALSLEFTTPEGKRTRFEADPPPGF